MKNKIAFILIIAALFTCVISCKKDNTNPDNYVFSETPVLPETEYNYPNSSNDAKATLGRVLFYDKNLSLNGSIACASCHQQNRAFTDNLQFSTGFEDLSTPRNTPSIFAKQGRMFWDGRASNFFDLALRPVKNHIEMGFENLGDLVKKLNKLNYYQQLFTKAYGTSEIDTIKIQSALAEFLINFNFSNNKFNRVKASIDKYNASELLGKEIFFGKGNCSMCHHIDGGFSSNGYGFANGDFNIGLDIDYKDKGIGAITNPENDGRFMVPVLLNVEYTAPYMHDGRFKTLEEVVEHYNSGIKNNINLDVNLRDLSIIEGKTEEEIMQLLDLNKDNEIDMNEVSNLPPLKLNLTAAEKKGLVDFLKTLSDPTILKDKRFSNPFLKYN